MDDTPHQSTVGTDQSAALRAEIARLNGVVAEQTRAAASSARVIDEMRESLRIANTPKPLWRKVAGKIRRAPRSIRRRYRLRALRRTIEAERPEVSSAELERRRAVVDRFLEDTSPPVATKPRTTALVASSLSLATSLEPVVSVIIPVHNAIDELMACLRSFVNHPPRTPYEVIIANDCSDETQFERVRSVAGATILDNGSNLGFLVNCNAAVDHARGRFIWFLNSDTEIVTDSLDALVATFEEDPSLAIVGSQLRFGDGRLQEAGGIVWNDATAWNYGRGEDPTAPRFSYARRVDYVSGASLMVRRDRFEEFGRFDTAYSPAYYEDTDLCMTASQAGYSVRYQPASVVIHHEGASHGTDLSDSGSLKHHQVLNHETFLRKWHLQLASRRANGVEPELEKERDVAMRVLILDARMLTPDQDSGSLRMLNMIRAFNQLGAKVTLAPQNLIANEPYSSALQRNGVEVIAAPHYRNIKDFLSERGAEFDIVLLSRLEVAAELFSLVRTHCPAASVVYDTVDLHFLRQVREQRLNGEVTGGFDHEKTRELEIMCTQRSDITFVCSTSEKSLLAELVPDALIEVVGNIHEITPTTTPPSERRGMLFVGGFEHPPNLDAIEWFIADVLPMIVAEIPDALLHVIGSKVPTDLHALSGPHVRIHGFVPDLEPFYESARVVVAPLRFGAGVKGKVTQALSNGVPCVGTSVAFEGSGFIDDRDVVVANEAQAFAEACISLATDDARWHSLRSNGLIALEENFGLSRATERLADALSVLREPRKGNASGARAPQ